MPSRNSSKKYLENSYYHIYNRGVEKRTIFLDSQDYSVFLSYLKSYLSPPDPGLAKKLADKSVPWQEKDQARRSLQLNNFHNDILMIAFALMPNHFHFLIKQKNAGAMDKFMNSLGTRYTMYFNKKYQRVGPLYQGVYKAALITNNAQLLQLSRYIHKQVLDSFHLAGQDKLFSLPEYLGERQTPWVNPSDILQFFSKIYPAFSYRSFVGQKDPDSIASINQLTLEDSED